MKKKILLVAAFATSVIAASATILWTGSCGAQVYTVSSSFFDSEEEASDFYAELEEILCGSEGEYTLQ